MVKSKNNDQSVGVLFIYCIRIYYVSTFSFIQYCTTTSTSSICLVLVVGRDQEKVQLQQVLWGLAIQLTTGALGSSIQLKSILTYWDVDASIDKTELLNTVVALLDPFWPFCVLRVPGTVMS